MKRIFLIILSIVAIAAGADAKKMSDLKIYINPGHGGYTGNDRPIHIYPFAANDSAGYWESKSNLYKGLHMYHILDSLGTKAYLSRTKNTEADDRSLSGICTEANRLGVDFMLSIHSNAGENVNYPLMLYREQVEGTPRYPEAIRMSQIMWQTLHSNKLPVWTRDKEYIAGDLTFYKYQWEGGLGVLRTLYVLGMLSEGSMHEHRPEAHRLMNDDVWWLEAWHFVRAIMEFFDTEDRFVTGNVAGVVYDTHNIREMIMPANFTQFGRDCLAPLNGATVELVDAAGNVVQKRTTDDMYNGCFVFRNVSPGKYKVRTSRSDYYTEEKEVTVTANEVTYQDMPMDMRREFNLAVTEFSPNAAEGEKVSCSSKIELTFNTDIDVESFEKAFKIEPAVEGYFKYSNSYRKVVFTPDLSLQRNTHYKVTIDRSARHHDPHFATPTLAEDFVIEFDTRDRDKLEVIGHFPADGGEVHYQAPKIEFRFDNSVDGTTIYKAVGITDSKGNKVGINTRSTVYNKLTDGFGNIIYSTSTKLTPGETYTLTLTTLLRDREQLPIGEDIKLSFKATDVSTIAGTTPVIEDFEAEKALFVLDMEASEGLDANTAAAIRSTSEKLFDRSCAKMNYTFEQTRGGQAVWNYVGDIKQFNTGETVGVHINGDFSDHELYLVLVSGTDTKLVPLGLLDYRGWQYRTVKLDMLDPSYPYQIGGLRLVQTESHVTRKGSFCIDNITREDASGVEAVTTTDSKVSISLCGTTLTVGAPVDVKSITVYNPAGTLCAAATDSNTVDIAALAAGVYIVTVDTADGGHTALRLAL